MINKRCQVFTPEKVVSKILDLIGYSDNPIGKKALENSCGDGSILSSVLIYYIQAGKRMGLSTSEIAHGLENDIWGFEIDPALYEQCIEKLNAIAAENGIADVRWRIFNEDALAYPIDQKFDYVIGNPPYITYSDLDVDTRIFIRENFSVCKNGKPDYYYAFIQSAIAKLKPGGKLAYLVPNNFFKTQYAEDLRAFLLDGLIEICDFTSSKLFGDKLTSSTIILYQNGGENRKSLKYYDATEEKALVFEKKYLSPRWVFSSCNQFSFKIDSSLFGDFFNVANSVATLRNDVFVIPEEHLGSDSETLLEESILRPAASPKSKRFNRKEYIIFPYYYENNCINKYSEEDFCALFPKAYKYLEARKGELSARKSDKGCSWFEYGRSQALSHLNQEKLLMSTIITREVHLYLLSEKCIPYSGLYITPKDGHSLSRAKRILESKAFYDYVEEVGIHANGKSFRITAKDILTYPIPRN